MLWTGWRRLPGEADVIYSIKTTNNVVLTEEVLIVWESVRGMGYNVWGW